MRFFGWLLLVLLLLAVFVSLISGLLETRHRLERVGDALSRLRRRINRIQTTTGPTGGEGEPSSITGPTGPNGGPQGDTGPEGPEGPQGDIGATGPTGSASTVAGPPGPAGAQGRAGSTGPTGTASTVAGPTGTPGTAGGAGPTGPTGVVSITPGDTGAVVLTDGTNLFSSSTLTFNRLINRTTVKFWQNLASYTLPLSLGAQTFVIPAATNFTRYPAGSGINITQSSATINGVPNSFAFTTTVTGNYEWKFRMYLSGIGGATFNAQFHFITDAGSEVSSTSPQNTFVAAAGGASGVNELSSAPFIELMTASVTYGCYISYIGGTVLGGSAVVSDLMVELTAVDF